MKILVTGGAGFIGSNLVKVLMRDGHKIAVIDNFNNYYNPDYKHENIKDIKDERFTLFNIDITRSSELSQALKNHRFDKIIHLAASVGVRHSFIDPFSYVKNNVEGTLNILKIAKELGVKDFIFASSSSVYGNGSVAPFKENILSLKPISPYATSKLNAELACFNYHKKWGLNITIHRFFTVYGPNGRPDMSPYLFTKNLLEGNPIQIYGDGNSTRDFTYVDDIVNGIMLSLNNPFPFEIFNLGSSSPVNMLTFVKTLEKICEKKAKIEFLSKQLGDVNHTHADTRKAKKLLNFKSQISLDQGLYMFLEWYKKHRVNSY